MTEFPGAVARVRVTVVLEVPRQAAAVSWSGISKTVARNLTATQVEYASVIHTSGKDLLDLLNRILDLAKVESGTVTVEMSHLSLGQLRGDLLRQFEPVAQGKGLGYSIDLAPDVPDDIVTDQQRLRQILKNLLANAFKFSEQGAVHVEVARAGSGWSRDTESLAEAPSVIAISVRDTGIGIEPEQQRRIFEPFAQGDGTTARLYGGTGLGLSISRELVGLLGGQITVASTPGRGSTFTIYLPSGRVAAVVPSTVSAATVPAPEPPGLLVDRDVQLAMHIGQIPDRMGSGSRYDLDFDGARILVVDDDFRNIFAMTAMLERGHATVTVAESGRDAIAILERTLEIDIVLMDIMMPSMDGYATIRAIRAFDRFKSLPIVAVTGKVMPASASAASMPAPTTSSPSPSTTPSCWPC